jgi:hypothetical protein
MAKRAPIGEVPYNPLDMSLAQSVVKGAGRAQEDKLSLGDRGGEGSAENPPHASSAPIKAQNAQVVAMPKQTNQESIRHGANSRSLIREKRVLLTPEEERQVERLVDRVGEQLGTSLKLSHLLRACMAVLCHAEEELHRHAGGLRPLSRPANGDAVALAQFEHALARILSKALRDAPAMR